MNPFEYYRQVRDTRWSGARGLKHPFENRYQPLQALRALATLSDSSSFAWKQSQSGEAPLSEEASWPAGRFPHLAVSCQLSLLWAILANRWNHAALERAARRLAGFLSPLIEARLTTLWTTEREYCAEETALSTNLLLRALGRSTFDMQSIEGDGFFSRLDVSRPTLQCEGETLSDPALGYQLFRGHNTAWAVASKGWQMPAGALRMGDVEIPAFGPHGAPLSDPLRFGILGGDHGWFASFDVKKTWFRIEPIETKGGEISFVLHSRGVCAEQGVAFVFYVRADECRIADRTYKPKSLQRFSADAERMTLSSAKTNIVLSLDKPSRLDVIPLSGGPGLWGASFLIAVWLSPLDSKNVFTLQQVS